LGLGGLLGKRNWDFIKFGAIVMEFLQ